MYWFLLFFLLCFFGLMQFLFVGLYLSFFFLFFSLWGFSGFDGVFYFDSLSMFLVFVSVWIFVLSLVAMDLGYSGSLFIIFMLIFIIFSFFTTNFVLFYLSFEFVFLLMFIFLLGWGKSGERLQASYYMFFYTMVFSLPFLVMLVDYMSSWASLFFGFHFFLYSDYFWVFMVLVFLVKLPLFGFHLWLPKAHVEAPVSGSMILAGVLLKLGGYGLIRFFPLLKKFDFFNNMFLGYAFYVSLFGGLVVSWICSRQMDLKMLIAYSSVVHMSVMILGLFSFSFWGLWGSLMMMVAHGFVSPLLFFLMTLIYNNLHSRSLMVLKGMILFSPLFCLMWFFSCILNLSVPPFMSFFSEIFIIGSMGFLSFFDFVLIILLCFFVGVYCIFMYSSVSHGSFFWGGGVFCFSFKHVMVSFSHLFFVFVFPLLFFYS